MAVDERSFRFWRANPKRKQRGERKPAQSYNTFARGESGGGKDKTRNNLSPNTIPGSKGDWAESYVQTPSPWQTYLLDTFSSTKSAQDSIEKQGELKVPRGTDLDLEMTDVELESQDSRPSKRAWPTFVWRGGRSDCAYIPLLCRASPASASTSASSPLGPRSKRAEEASVGMFMPRFFVFHFLLRGRELVFSAFVGNPLAAMRSFGSVQGSRCAASVVCFPYAVSAVERSCACRSAGALLAPGPPAGSDCMPADRDSARQNYDFTAQFLRTRMLTAYA